MLNKCAHHTTPHTGHAPSTTSRPGRGSFGSISCSSSLEQKQPSADSSFTKATSFAKSMPTSVQYTMINWKSECGRNSQTMEPWGCRRNAKRCTPFPLLILSIEACLDREAPASPACSMIHHHLHRKRGRHSHELRAHIIARLARIGRHVWSLNCGWVLSVVRRPRELQRLQHSSQFGISAVTASLRFVVDELCEQL